MFLNLSAYRFIDLEDLPALRQRIDEAGRRHRLTGTVLVAPEGINLFVSAPADAARAWLADLADLPAFAGLDVKESWSDTVAFQRWKVKIKREIITFGQPGLRPQDGRAPAVSPATLRRWLDAGRDDEGLPVVVVDTRNRFEVQAGSFDDALDLGLRSFTGLPQAVDARRDALAGHRVVTFCTGGIRCEKAALQMARDGIDHVVQLEGGVLRYFEEVGGAHWHGELFVFDRRTGLDPALAPVPASVPAPVAR